MDHCTLQELPPLVSFLISNNSKGFSKIWGTMLTCKTWNWLWEFCRQRSSLSTFQTQARWYRWLLASCWSCSRGVSDTSHLWTWAARVTWSGTLFQRHVSKSKKSFEASPWLRSSTRKLIWHSLAGGTWSPFACSFALKFRVLLETFASLVEIF